MPIPTGVVTLFGPTGVTLGGQRAEVRGAKAQGLLALLALERGRFVHADRITSSLWDDVETDTVASLRVRVSELRRAFDQCEPGARRYLEGRYPLYRLSDELTTDAEQAHVLLNRAIAALPLDPAAAAELLARARHLVRGDPLAEILRLPFAPLAAVRLSETRLTVEDAHIDALMATGDLDAAATAARALVSAEPLREARVRVLASILAEQGASREALRELDRYAKDLHREISTTPGAAFSELRRRITCGWGRPPTEADDRSQPEELDPQLARHLTSTFIGRSEELALIENVHHSVVASGQSRAVEIVGVGGSGKSTLAAHAAAAAASRGSRVLYVAWPAEQYASLTPLAETGLIDPIRRRDARPRNELRDLTREFVATLRADSSGTPLTVVFDDFPLM